MSPAETAIAMISADLPGLLAASVLALVHIAAAHLRFVNIVTRSRLLSVAGGISVAYVFVHLLPELGMHQANLERAVDGLAASINSHAYLVALIGLATFYGLERVVQHDRRQQRDRGQQDSTSASVFWISIGSFGLYNALVGYLLVEQARTDNSTLTPFTLAMGLHLLANDYALRKHHQDRYVHAGQWILAAAVLAGALGGVAVEVPPVMVSILAAFLAGGIILNVLKEELPEERESRFLAFVAGAGVYAALLVAV